MSGRFVGYWTIFRDAFITGLAEGLAWGAAALIVLAVLILAVVFLKL